MRRAAAVVLLLVPWVVLLPSEVPGVPTARPVVLGVAPSRPTPVATPRRAAPAPSRALPSPRASRRASRGRVAVVTAYCLRGVMADGRHVFAGAVAARDRSVPMGTRVRIGGRVYVVADRMARHAAAAWDVWMPSCADARAWGRRTVPVEVLR